MKRNRSRASEFQIKRMTLFEQGKKSNNAKLQKQLTFQIETNKALHSQFLQYDPEKDYKNIRVSSHQSIALTPMNDLQLAMIYSDNFPLFKIRKMVLIRWKRGQQIIYSLTQWSYFQILMLVIIGINSILIAVENDDLEYLFIGIYTVEFILKLFGNGLIYSGDGYFRNLWNIFDFIILIANYLFLFTEIKINLSSLRTFRILQSLTSIESIKPLHIILISLSESIYQLKDAAIMLLFSYSVFALIGLIIFSGVLKYRCISEIDGIQVNDQICNACDSGWVCAKTLSNPNFDINSFDTFGWSFLQVFIGTTMEGWSTIMFYIVSAYNNYAAAIYFIAIVLFGGFFLVNLTLAIIKLSFTNAKLPIEKKKQANVYDYWNLRRLQIYKPIRPISQPQYGCNLDRERQQQQQQQQQQQFQQQQEQSKRIKHSNTIFLNSDSPKNKKKAFQFGSASKSQRRFNLKPIRPSASSQAEVKDYHDLIKKDTSFEYQQKIETRKPTHIEKKPEKESDELGFKIITSKVEQEDQKLKHKLFLTRFAVIVKYDTYISTSEIDVIKKSLIAQKIYKEKAQKKEFKRATIKIIYKIEEENKQIQLDLEETNMKKAKKQEPKQLTYYEAQKKIRKSYVFKNKYDIEPIFIKLEKIDILHLDINQIKIRASIYYQEYQNLIKQQIETKILSITSSVEDVLQIGLNISEKLQIRINSIINDLNNQERDYWNVGFWGVLKVIQKQIHIFVLSQLFNKIINYCVAFNTIILALNGLVEDDQLENFNLFFIVIFSIELVLKLIGLGPKQYFTSKSNLFDALIVVLSIFELTIYDMEIAQRKTFRIFRSLRVLRIFKLIRSLKFMGFLQKVLDNAFQQIIYLFFLMLFFQYVFTLLGLNLFKGSLPSNLFRANFNSFLASYEIVFQVFTLSNWNSVLYSLLSSTAPIYLTLIYLTVWIALGNYVFLNLFLAVLLDTFETEYRKDKKQIDVNIVIAKDQELSQNSMISSLKKSSLLQIQEFNSQKKFIYYLEFEIAEYSLYIFSQENIIRKICYRIIKDFKFEIVVLLFILISSIKLILDTYEFKYQIQDQLGYIDISLVCIFSLEAIMKIIALGLVFNPSSYLRNYWNCLDFFILTVSIIDVSMNQVDFGFIKILRLFRTLRPLRFISHYSSMKILVSALLQSVEGIFNVGIVIILVWMIFAIIGINLTQGKLNYCNMHNGLTLYVDQQHCEGDWEVRPTNFENIFSGMLTLFILSTLVSWPDYLLYFKDGTINGPIKNYDPYMFWFFASFILIGSILLINLFIGVILVNFHIAEEKSRDPSFSAEQLYWLDTQKLIIEANPNFSFFYSPSNRFRAMIFHVVKLKYFDYFVIIIIVANVIVTASKLDDSSISYQALLDNLNFYFSLFFILEALMKIIAFSPLGYFRSKQNQFNFGIVLTSILDFSITDQSVAIDKLFRIIRVARIFRLVNFFDILQKVVDTAVFSIPAIINAAILYFLFHSIFSVMAVFLFQDIKTGTIIDENVNFSDFHHSFVILFRSQTGEDWQKVMFDTMYRGSFYNVIFWIVFIVIQEFIMLNLFILIILDQYDMNYFNLDNPLYRFKSNQQIFLKAWTQLSPQGQYIQQSKLVELMLIMEEPLGFDIEGSTFRAIQEWKAINQSKNGLILLKRRIKANFIKNAALKIMNMSLQCNSEGLLDFHQVFFGFLRESILPKIIENLNQKVVKKIGKKESQTKSIIANLTDLKYVEDVNPVTRYLYKYLVFHTFLHFSKLEDDEIIEESYEFDDSIEEEVDEEINTIYSINSQQPEDKLLIRKDTNQFINAINVDMFYQIDDMQ